MATPRTTSAGARTALFAAAAAFLAVLAALFAPAPTHAQTPAPAPLDVSYEVFAGSELEGYLRTLQNVGRAASAPWSIRPFGPAEVRALGAAAVDAGHPWAHRYAFSPAGVSEGASAGASEDAAASAASGSASAPTFEAGWIRPRMEAVYNSAFPWGGDDGPVWTGRGLTTSVRAGAFVRYGPLSLVVAPVAFWAQNRDFELAPLPGPGDNPYRDPRSPSSVDLPQRFGDEAYARLDPGYTTLRLDAGPVAAGFSTAAQQWGPMDRYPLLMGPNAGGFPHVFLGTARPLGIGLGDLHLRYVAGKLEESDWAPASAAGPSRSGVGFVAAFQPRGLEGLEVGTTRFIHRDWPEGGPGSSELLQPFEDLFKKNIPDADTRFPDNQLFSVFARWNAPRAGIEVFGEFVRIDHAVDARVLVEEPDDLSGYALGVRRVWGGGDVRGAGSAGGSGSDTGSTDGTRTLTVLRAEVLGTVSNHRQRGGARLQFAYRARHMYQHGGVSQGHTHRGQLLASSAGHAGEAAIFGVDRYDDTGRWTVELERRVERDRTVGEVGEDPAPADVGYALGVSALRRAGGVEAEAGVRAVYGLNRYLQDDRFTLNLELGAVVPIR